MKNRVLTTHVGSLPRPARVMEMIAQRDAGQPVDDTTFESAITDAVEEVVSKQVSAGIDVVSDGEMSRVSYATYVKDRCSGFALGEAPPNLPLADMLPFPSLVKTMKESGAIPSYLRPVCVGPIAYHGHNALDQDIKRFVAALARHKDHRGFMTSASPGVVAMFLPNTYYESREQYLLAIADALSHEYRAIVASGLDIQIDCPDLALSRHGQFAGLSDEEFLTVAHTNLDILNHALQDIPSEKVRLHLCWGNYGGPHICDIAMEKVFPILMKAHARYLSFENANPRHQHEWQVFQDRARDIPDDKILMPGVIDTTTNRVEHPALVAQRLSRFVDIVGAQRVIGGSDCGFATFAGFGSVDHDVVYVKLSALADGARLVHS